MRGSSEAIGVLEDHLRRRAARAFSAVRGRGRRCDVPPTTMSPVKGTSPASALAMVDLPQPHLADQRQGLAGADGEADTSRRHGRGGWRGRRSRRACRSRPSGRSTSTTLPASTRRSCAGRLRPCRRRGAARRRAGPACSPALGAAKSGPTAPLLDHRGPVCMTMTRSAISATTPMSWVMRMIAGAELALAGRAAVPAPAPAR